MPVCVSCDTRWEASLPALLDLACTGRKEGQERVGFFFSALAGKRAAHGHRFVFLMEDLIGLEIRGPP